MSWLCKIGWHCWLDIGTIEVNEEPTFDEGWRYRITYPVGKGYCQYDIGLFWFRRNKLNYSDVICKHCDQVDFRAQRLLKKFRMEEVKEREDGVEEDRCVERGKDRLEMWKKAQE